MAKSSNVGTFVVVGLAVSAVAAMAIAFGGKRGGSKLAIPAKEKDGYTVLANCAGVTIHDQGQADAYAAAQGATAQKFTVATGDAWGAAAAEQLGFSSICPVKASAGPFYRLLVNYVGGAVGAGKITELEGKAVLGVIADNMIKGGVSLKVLEDALKPVPAPKPPVDQQPAPVPKPPAPPKPVPEPPPPAQDQGLPAPLPIYQGQEENTYILSMPKPSVFSPLSESDANKDSLPIVAKVKSDVPKGEAAPIVLFIGAIGKWFYDWTGMTYTFTWPDSTIHQPFFWTNDESSLAGVNYIPGTRFVFLRSGPPLINPMPDFEGTYTSGKGLFQTSPYQYLVNQDGQFSGGADLTPDWFGDVYWGSQEWTEYKDDVQPSLANAKSPVVYFPKKGVKLGADERPSDLNHWYYSPGWLINDATDDVEMAIAQLRSVFPTTKVYVVGYSLAGSVVYELARRHVVNGAVVVNGIQKVNAKYNWADKNPPKVFALHGKADPFVTYTEVKASRDETGAPGTTFQDPFAGHDLASMVPTLNLVLKQLVSQ